jgi:hypothetical protein
MKHLVVVVSLVFLQMISGLSAHAGDGEGTGSGGAGGGGGTVRGGKELAGFMFDTSILSQIQVDSMSHQMLNFERSGFLKASNDSNQKPCWRFSSEISNQQTLYVALKIMQMTKNSGSKLIQGCEYE